MARAAIRKIDIKRAIEAARSGGINISRIEIDGPKVIIVSAPTDATPANDLDKWLAKHAG